MSDPVKTTPEKWLRCLMYIHLISIANSLIGWLPISGSLTTWISRMILVGVTAVMFCMSSISVRYKKSAVCRAIWLCCTLINSLLFTFSAFMLAASLLSFIAVYQEYAGHAEITAETDPKLSRNWGSLFGWSILVPLLTSFVSTAIAIFIFAADVDASATLNIIMGILEIAQLVVDGFYLWYLIRTIRLFEQEA